MSSNLKINSKNVTYTPHDIVSNFVYQTTKVDSEDGQVVVTPVDVNVTFKTKREPSKVGVMLIGWGGNNGSTFTGAYFANKHNISWSTKSGVKQPNWYGSMLQSSTVSLGFSENGEVFVPMRDLIPMANPNNLFVDGWDISSHNLHESMQRAEVFDYDLQQKLAPYMSGLKPRPAIHREDFVAANQSDRANNLLSGSAWDQVNTVRNDIKDFKAKHNLDKVIIIWTANTERFCEVMPGIHDTAENLIKSIKNDEEEISPSTLYAVASILEGCSYINGSPQNTFVPAVLDLAEKNNVFLGGDDFKSGQTKIKSVLVDFLVSAGIKPVSIVSYNHLGNNDGKNLSAPKQFRSKEITKSNVVDDMVESNQILYDVGEKPDHVVVIKYVPTVADSKRAMDEYTSEIFMHGTNTIVLHNTCEDSLLATPIILDLILLTELFERVQISVSGGEYQSFNSVLSLLSYLLKAPLVPEGAPVVNALFKQRAAIENVLRAMLSLPPQNHMTLEHRLADMSVFRKELKLPQIVKNNVHPTVHQKKHVANGHSLNGNNISLTNGTNGLVTNGNGYH